jgi:hypothetical protein
MRSNHFHPIRLSVIYFVSLGLMVSTHLQAAALPVNDGSVILRMCKGADKVKALSVMCHSYLNGYIDGAHHFGKGKVAFCLGAGDKEKVPSALVAWIDANQTALKQPAGAVLQQALTASFPCKGKK